MKKSACFTMAAVMMLALGGCGRSANNLGGATDGYGNGNYGSGYTDSYGYDGNTYGYNDTNNTNGYHAGTNTSSGGGVYWDGYGINSGRPFDTNPAGDWNSVGADGRAAGRNVVNGADNFLDGNTASVAG